MVMCATILAIGPFSPDIGDCLGYPAMYYSKTQAGSIVVTELFEIIEGTGVSTDFAMHLGISDPWDFNQHRFDPSRIDITGLQALFQTLTDGAGYMKELDRLLRLRAHGFQLIFRPNG